MCDGVRHVWWCQIRVVVSDTYGGVRHVWWCQTHLVVLDTCGVVRHVFLRGFFLHLVASFSEFSIFDCPFGIL